MKNNHQSSPSSFYAGDNEFYQDLVYKKGDNRDHSKGSFFAKAVVILSLTCLLITGGVLCVKMAPLLATPSEGSHKVPPGQVFDDLMDKSEMIPQASFSITLNGAIYEVSAGQTLEEVVESSEINPQPGDLVAIDGSILQAGGGDAFCVTVNGFEVSDLSTTLAGGDVVEVSDGLDVRESITSIEEAIPFEVEVVGNGAIHLIEGEGVEGILLTEIGDVSGIAVEQVIQEPSNIIYRKVTPDVGDDKVIALTFDDGPWPGTTNEILDILEEYDITATFFVLGTYIKGSGAESVERAIADGHQICSHTYDHAAGSGKGVNLAYMTPEEQLWEIQASYDVLETILGGSVSHVIRAPGGNFNTDVVANVQSLVDAEIGWNIDTRDWSLPGVGFIVEQILSAWSGSIVLLHDGGGDRSQTVEALKIAIPYLIEQGYTFVTIDELMAYPMK